jgi:hypothetical protein
MELVNYYYYYHHHHHHHHHHLFYEGYLHIFWRQTRPRLLLLLLLLFHIIRSAALVCIQLTNSNDGHI